MKDIADFPATMLGGTPGQHDVADEFAGRNDLDTKKKCLTFSFENAACP